VFVDTSVFVAILSREADAEHWSSILRDELILYTSGVVVLETVMRLSTKLATPPRETREIVAKALLTSEIQIVPIGEAETDLAIDAFARYGKGRGHPAQLNIADCLSYACAKKLGVPLLYKGNDFARTDLA
jgi:ribonuclease VapC